MTDDGLTVEMVSIRFNESNTTTLIELAAGDKLSENLEGRILRLEDRWAVVQSNDAHSITVWGNIATRNEGGTNAEILPTYRIR